MLAQWARTKAVWLSYTANIKTFTTCAMFLMIVFTIKSTNLERTFNIIKVMCNVQALDATVQNYKDACNI